MRRGFKRTDYRIERKNKFVNLESFFAVDGNALSAAFRHSPAKELPTASGILKLNGKFGALSDKEKPSSEQVTYCTLFFGISICDREHSSEKLTFFFTEFFFKNSLRAACLQFSLNRFYRFLFFLRELTSCNRHAPARNRFPVPHRNLQPSTR